jgi:hypothetical protein
MTDTHLVLHVGLPKCGSSALQTALTQTPDLHGEDRRLYRYVSARKLGRGLVPFYGDDLRQVGQASRYGYTSFPNFTRADDPSPMVDAIKAAWMRAKAEDHVAILSNEGWITGHAVFEALLKDLGYPPVSVVALMRPPLDWLNAAYWQWGVWTTHDISGWLERSNLSYSFGTDLQAWSRIPNVRLHIRRAQPDAVRRFSRFIGCDLPAVGTQNASAPPSLVGFLRRNRQFRAGPHDSSVEFVFQRWCPPVREPKLWAIQAGHVNMLRPALTVQTDAILSLLDAGERRDLLQDVRWRDESPYHALIRAGIPSLRDPEGMAALLESFCAGARAAASAAGGPAPALPSAPPSGATEVEVWDPVLAQAFEALLKADQAARNKLTASRSGLKARALGLMARFGRP